MSEDINQVIYGMESPNHTFISYSFWRFVEADFKRYSFVFDYLYEDSRSKKNIEKIDFTKEMYWLRAFHCIFTRDS